MQKIVNDKIFDSMNVTVQEMPVEEAKKLGAMALFGEKYGKVVRVVDIEGWSTEFCGGTHVKNTAQIGGFKIVSESSVAAGIRRIEAVTGRNLLIRANLQEAMLHDVANTLKANNVASLPARAEAVMAENKAMSRELEEMKAKIAASKVDSLFDNAEEADGVKIASAYFTGTTGDTLRGMCDSIRDKAVNPVVAVLVGKAEDKITMAVTVNKLAQEKGLKAGVLVKELSAIAGGKGGGKPDFAMAGLKDETKIDEGTGCCERHRQEGSGLKRIHVPARCRMRAGAACFCRSRKECSPMEDCLFCMIAEGKIPSKKLYEDDQVVAFYDINPQAKVHFLVVPRKHISSAAALTEEDAALLGHIFTVITKLAKEQGLENGYRIISNVGEDAGQTVKHLHFHVLGGEKLPV